MISLVVSYEFGTFNQSIKALFIAWMRCTHEQNTK